MAESLEIDGEANLIKGVYNRVIKDFGVGAKSFKITTYNDAPAGSGLGTSSTMVVCILKAFVEWLGLPLGDYEISRLAYEIERKDLGLSGGKHGGGGAQNNGQGKLDSAHGAASSPQALWAASLRSMGLRSTSSSARMQTMDGMRKLPAPNTSRQAKGTARPMRPE